MALKAQGSKIADTLETSPSRCKCFEIQLTTEAFKLKATFKSEISLDNSSFFYQVNAIISNYLNYHLVFYKQDKN
jgi:hypothetical protein